MKDRRSSVLVNLNIKKEYIFIYKINNIIILI